MPKPSRKATPRKPPSAKHGYDGRFKPGQKEVKNPNPVGPDRITVDINTKHDAVETLLARGRITEAQKQAGDRVRALYEAMQGSGARGVDLGAVRVDGGQVARNQSLSQLEAIETLGNLSRVLGKIGYQVVILCAGQGFGLRQTADTWCGRTASRSEMDFISGTLQAALGEAAVHFGLQTPSKAPSARLARVCAAQR